MAVGLAPLELLVGLGLGLELGLELDSELVHYEKLQEQLGLLERLFDFPPLLQILLVHVAHH